MGVVLDELGAHLSCNVYDGASFFPLGAVGLTTERYLSVERPTLTFLRSFFSYLDGVALAAFQSGAGEAGDTPPPDGDGHFVIDLLWEDADGAAFGLTLEDFRSILLSVGLARNYGCSEGQRASIEQQSAFFGRLRLAELLLARACALGRASAWERFLALYRLPLIRSAVAITKSETIGRELADSLSAELYGLTMHNGQRHSPLNSYMGSGSLMGWLGATLSQRYVDHHRRRRRETPLEDFDGPATAPHSETPAVQLTFLASAVEDAIRQRDPEERFLLAAYYLDRRKLRQIGEMLNLAESTVSRRLGGLRLELRKQVVRNLQALGLSRCEAEEALETDPRDLELNLGKLLGGLRSDTSPGTVAK